MKYTREEHSKFLEEELQAQTEAYNQKLNTSAKFLLEEREEVFVTQFLKFEDGEMILKFSAKRTLPRKGDYLYCFTVPKELRNYRNWGNRTYGDLIKEKRNFTEAVCVWQAPAKDKDGNVDKDFRIAGFRGIDLDFATNIESAKGMILILGPNIPPFEYIANLQKIVKHNHSENVSSILDQDFQNTERFPTLLDNNKDIPAFILNKLKQTPQLILIGPPGTGKTHQIAEICKQLIEQRKSVLVTSLTNRALIEVVEKPSLKKLLDEGKILKTKVSADEKKEYPKLQQIKEVNPQPGNLILSTFYITSGVATKLTVPPFDYVIVDEASQALLAMFGAAKLLGKKNIWIGDTKQLPPIIALNEDKVNKKNYNFLVDGLSALSNISSFPVFQLTETYRLPERGANYTGLFYNNSLVSKAKKDIALSFSGMNNDIKMFFNPQGGPTLIKLELEIGNKKPQEVIELAKLLVINLLKLKEKLHISVLTNYVATVKALQKGIYGYIGKNPKNLLIDTIARIQGHTCDVTILVIPNSGYNHSLEKRLFNVATSRAKRHTIIIADKDIISSYPNIDETVKAYLQKANDEFSFYYTKENKLIESNTATIEQKNDDARNKTGLKILGKIDLSKFEKPKKEIKKAKKNIYIIDTNVFVDYPTIISKIDRKYQIVLSAKVIDELDYLKTSLTKEQKSNVQKALRVINSSIDKRNIKMDTANLKLLPKDFNKKSPDNFILAVALQYKGENPILLTSDNGLQIKSKGLGITTITLKEFLKQIRY